MSSRELLTWSLISSEAARQVSRYSLLGDTVEKAIESEHLSHFRVCFVTWDFHSTDLTLSIEKYRDDYLIPAAIALWVSVKRDCDLENVPSTFTTYMRSIPLHVIYGHIMVLDGIVIRLTVFYDPSNDEEKVRLGMDFTWKKELV